MSREYGFNNATEVNYSVLFIHLKFWRYLEAGEDNLEKKNAFSWIFQEAQF